MTGILLLCVAAGVAGPPEDGDDGSDVQAVYEQAQAAAGQDAEANVRLALWCESHGLRAERARHLAIALLADPEQALARALSGLVREGDRWLRPSQVVAATRDDAEQSARFEEYLGRRQRAGLTVEDQLELARWCEQNGLEREMRAHLITVLRLDPSRESSWKRLGYQKHQGRWMLPEQIEAGKAEAKAQVEADALWKPQLAKWKKELAAPKTHAAAQAALADVSDPRAVPSILAVFGTSTADLQIAVQLLGQIDDAAASRALAWIAVAADSESVRRAATETLTQRDPREYAGSLVGLIRTPLRYEVRPIGGPGSPGVLYVEGEQFNVQRLYALPTPPVGTEAPIFRLPDNGVLVVGPDGRSGFVPQRFLNPNSAGSAAARALGERLQSNPGDAVAILRDGARNGGQADGSPVAPDTVPGLAINADPFSGWELLQAGTNPAISSEGIENRRRYQQAVAQTQAQLQQDVQRVEGVNASIERTNQRVLPVLQQVTGLDTGADAKQWQSWWVDQNGFQVSETYQPKPTITQMVNQQPAYLPPRPRMTLGGSCFAAGTLVHTTAGLVEIERLRVGDVVVGQDAATGALSFEPVTAVRHNPPAPVHRLVIGDEEIRTTGLHRFWKVGTGWVLARALEPGDAVRVLGGVAKVESNEPGETVPVFNLIVDRNHDFFVGRRGVLAHDDTMPDRRVRPFDRVGELVAARP